ncbi:dynamin family protein [Acrocarpospora catenulata]|uniref:dynamin family protein n=1 Tax=Acrocarpospora catenulata TaxID=2836182 RepID=UPI001BD9F3FA|nr:dynamin family protein [Acrocarpospora catenulata]
MTTAPTAGDRLRELCATTAARLTDPALRERVRQVRARLDAPLQIAVAGAVSSGKSTLVNALLGLPVAPVDAGECTRVVTQYEYGPDDGRVDVECDNGHTTTTRLLPGHRLPSDLGVPIETVRRIRVQLASDTLRAITVVDTPGMNTVTVENEQAARRMIFGTDQDDDRAQALIYVLRYVQAFDDTTLAEFRGLTEACGMTCVNTLAVLSQIDRRGDEEDPWPTARRLAARAYTDLRASVFDVVPVIGLLAETAGTGALGPAELDGLAQLAELDEADLEFLLLDLDDLADSPDSPLTPEVAHSLVRHLHRYGLRTAVTASPQGSEAIRRTLLENSGFGAAARSGTVAGGIAHFARRADQLKALSAITQLRRISRAPAFGNDLATLDALADELDETKPIAAGLSGLRVFAAVEAVARGQLVLTDEMHDELLRLARSDDPAEQLGVPAAEVPEAARRATERWRARAMIERGRIGGQRARDVLGVLEDLAFPRAEPAPPPPAPPLAATPVNAEAVRRLLASPLVPAEDREALSRLLAGADGAAQVGAPGASAQEVAGYAAAWSTRFRSLSQFLTFTMDRRAAESVSDSYAQLAFAVQEGSPHVG